MRNQTIIENLKKQFTILEVDYYNDGDSIEIFVFNASDVTEEQANKLWDDYDEKYQNDEFDGAFEDYMVELGIEYSSLASF